jgi:hypothetical protein
LKYHSLTARSICRAPLDVRVEMQQIGESSGSGQAY